MNKKVYTEEQLLDPELLEQVEAWIRDGRTNKEVAKGLLGISVRTFTNYAKEYPKFAEAIRTTKLAADYKVENVLYKSALQGQPWAVQMWLKNRQPQKWNVQAVPPTDDETGTGVIQIAALSDEDEDLA